MTMVIVLSLSRILPSRILAFPGPGIWPDFLASASLRTRRSTVVSLFLRPSVRMPGPSGVVNLATAFVCCLGGL